MFPRDPCCSTVCESKSTSEILRFSCIDYWAPGRRRAVCKFRLFYWNQQLWCCRSGRSFKKRNKRTKIREHLNHISAWLQFLINSDLLVPVLPAFLSYRCGSRLLHQSVLYECSFRFSLKLNQRVLNVTKWGSLSEMKTNLIHIFLKLWTPWKGLQW